MQKLSTIKFSGSSASGFIKRLAFSYAQSFAAANSADVHAYHQASAMAPLKLYYFPLPGRAETARLMLTIGKVPFEDNLISWDDWSKWKPTTPFGQLPFMEVQGKTIAQTGAIGWMPCPALMYAPDHYCASLTSMLPSDPLKLAEAEQVYYFLEDIWSPLGPMDDAHFDDDLTEDERTKIYNKCLASDGEFKMRLGKLDSLLAKREGKFLAGDKMCFADLATFSLLSELQSGWMKGLPTSILAPYPACRQFRHMIASLPEVMDYYHEHDDDIRRTGYRPDPLEKT